MQPHPTGPPNYSRNATLAQSLRQQELLQIKLLTSGKHSCILEFQSELKATGLVTTNLWLTVQASLHLPYQRNQLYPSYHRVREAIAANLILQTSLT